VLGRTQTKYSGSADPMKSEWIDRLKCEGSIPLLHFRGISRQRLRFKYTFVRGVRKGKEKK